MKKLLITLFALFLGLQVNAATTTNWDSAAAQKRLNNIAYKIIKANSLPSGISVKVSNDDNANAYANINKEIYVFKGMLNYATTDDEIAAVLSHEIGHIVNGHHAKQSILNSIISSIFGTIEPKTDGQAIGVAAAEQISTSNLSRKDEYEADITAVDLLVKAGYNTLALISVLNKICGNYIDVISTHPTGEKRLMNIYDYTSYNYPALAKKGYSTDSYKKAYALISINVQERNASAKKVANWKKQQEKLKKDKIKRAKKMLKSNNGWNSAYTAIQIMSTPTTNETGSEK